MSLVINNNNITGIAIGNRDIIRITDSNSNVLWEKVSPATIYYVKSVTEDNDDCNSWGSQQLSGTLRRIDSGITYTDGMSVRLRYTPKCSTDGWTFCDRIVGYYGYDVNPEIPSANGFRLFGYLGGTFDCGYRTTGLNCTTAGTTYDITIGDNYVYDNTTSTYKYQGTAVGSVPNPKNTHIFVDVCWNEIEELIIKDANNTTVFDGKAAYDSNGHIGLYDTVSNSMKYNSNLTMTYEDYQSIVFRAEQANSTIGMTHYGTNQSTTKPLMYYSTDNKATWTQWDYTTITLSNAGDKVYFYGTNPNGFSTSLSNYSSFVTSGSLSVGGNIMALISGDSEILTVPSGYCFTKLFDSTSITTAPEFPATTLKINCYREVFLNCANLVTAPELPATNLAEYCYQFMFKNCTSMTIAPELPATTLANYCYKNMFEGCIALIEAPLLPATTLVTDCYRSMFYGCSSLNKIEVGATYWLNQVDWVKNVAATGMFFKPSTLVIGTGTGQIPSNDTRGIPIGWTFIDKTTEDYFYVQARENSSILTIPSGVAYSTDKVNWNTDGVQMGISLNAGDMVYLAEMPSWTSGSSIETTYGTFNVGGNFSTFVTGDNTINYPTIVNQYNALFKNCTGLIDASNLKLNVDFSTVQWTFNGMFMGCTSLLTAPELPATTLSNYCYNGMFGGCTNLKIAPELPATTLVQGCYRRMFNECTSLKSAPELPAITLEDWCYDEMFDGCTSLNSIVCLATDITATLCTNLWVRGVSSTGTFTKNPNMSIWATNDSGIPTGWTVVDI